MIINVNAISIAHYRIHLLCPRCNLRACAQPYYVYIGQIAHCHMQQWEFEDNSIRLHTHLIHDAFQWWQYGASVYCISVDRIDVDFHLEVGSAGIFRNHTLLNAISFRTLSSRAEKLAEVSLKKAFCHVLKALSLE